MQRLSLAALALTASVVASGCTPTDPTLFIGVWAYQLGSTVTNSCGESGPLTGNMTITQGTTSDLNVTYGNCTSLYDAGNNNTVNLVTGTGCVTPAVSIPATSGTLTISGDHNTLNQKANGSLNVVFISCTMDITGTLTRVSQ